MSKITKKIKTFLNKVRTFFSLLCSPNVPKKDAWVYLYKMIRYAFGQVLAYSGIGRYVPFSVRGEYCLYLTKSPVAMVAFGDPTATRDEEHIAKDILHEGDTCLDVGANIGNFSLCAARLVGTTGHIFTFEAHPRTHMYAERNIALNKIPEVSLLGFAIGEKKRTISFSDDAYDDINHVQEHGGVTVPMIRLDDCEQLKNLESIACLKIDIEGYELHAFKGAVETLKKTKYVLFELYEKSAALYGHHADDVYDFLVLQGFEIVDPKTRTPFDRKYLRKDSIQNLLAVRN